MHIIAKVIEKRQDVQFAIVGDGTALEDVKKMAKKLQILPFVDFYGMVTQTEKLLDILNACDIGVNPDVPDHLNDLLTTNKVMEYMSLKIPVVQFELKEGRASAGDASLYAEKHDLQDFAEKIMYLLDHPEIREEMGERGYQRVFKELSWEQESKKLVDLYSKVLEIE